ncbi:MAG TPA: DUF2279 domain-containing protein [Spirochaetota bacterium]|jgi:hypothetical protein|nr:DUF2279 domain-containing protein [Spirochaetota bacterium]
MKRLVSICISLFFVLTISFPLLAQEANLENNAINDSSDSATVTYSENRDFKRKATYWTIAGSFALVYYYGAEAWDWGEGGFRWGDEGWFGANTPSGGMDKLGHMWAHYAVMRGFNNLFEYTLEDKKEALILSTSTAAAIGLLIELGDGTSSSWGFSYQDLIFDWLGVGLGVVLEAFPVADEFIGFTWEYWPTDNFLHESKGRKKFHVTGDYSGHKYMINFKLAGFKAIGWDIPEFLRYIMIDFGYYTRGYTDYEDPGTEKTRHPYIGISINFMEIVKDFFDEKDQNSRLCKGLQQPFKYMHVPVGYEAQKTLHSGNYN